MIVLILGSSGMIGSTILRVLSDQPDWEVFGTIRGRGTLHFFSESIKRRLLVNINVQCSQDLVKVLDKLRPDVVINCVGITNHQTGGDDPLPFIDINAMMPHRLSGLCSLIGARLIHISSDCVFSGEKGNYTESDFTDARDIYGKTKALGEVIYSNTVTLRTSFIGHELGTKFGLLEWFLSQNLQCKGYTRVVFSGLPTVIFAEIVRDIVIPAVNLSGIYNVSATPISKYALLTLIADIYGKNIDIIKDDELIIDRSLNSSRFRLDTGYLAPEWPELIKLMHVYK
jgi:dTDP-4-dehydrorhamnose reductase